MLPLKTKPSTPVALILFALAFSEVHCLFDTVFSFTRANAKFAPANISPEAFVSPPLSPAKTLRLEAPIVKTSALMSALLESFKVKADFLNAKFPSA